MAAPASVTIKSLDGKWVLAKSLSDATDPVLALQGLGWLTRKAIGLATVTQHVSSWTTPADTTDATSATPLTHMKIEQFATGGIKGTTENRTLDWMYRPHTDHLFGSLQGKSRYTTLAALLAENTSTTSTPNSTSTSGSTPPAAKAANVAADARYLCASDASESEAQGGWLPESRDGEVVEAYVENDGAGWTAWQVWGFSSVGGDGERWLTRRFAVRRTDREEVVRVRLVYEWRGAVEEG
ncbi:hypothetical protein BDV95DRAFT_630058 [Massariosphaeria phaeospora]|uniref:Uncharacterized protein n=1 Tax=Massariosphaeria phaeospora TaxID=100035 RepID=A0A7C8I308_9PLEO|nr:hypothetical protein BDV95DRAFT_630058 [Massariosphaeria phaeospora]